MKSKRETYWIVRYKYKPETKWHNHNKVCSTKEEAEATVKELEAIPILKRNKIIFKVKEVK